MEEEDKCKILHARNFREYRLPDLPHFSVDGYCAETRTVFEFMGCFFHRWNCQPFRDLKTLGEDTLTERYEQTMLRIEQIPNANYTVKVMWEWQFDASKIVERKPHLQTHPIVRNSPLYTRDALYGGRTEAMRLHYKIEEDAETIQYYDVMSLYPYICKYFKFPIGHPIIHVGDMQKHWDVSADGGPD